MSLQFDPSAYGQAYQQGQQNLQSDRDARNKAILDSLASINQGISGYQNYRQQQALLDLANRKENRESIKFNSEYGTPIDPNAMSVSPYAAPQTARSIFMPGGQGQVAQPSPLIDRFNQWRASNYSKSSLEPDFMPALGKDERKMIFERDNPKPPSVFMSPYQEASLGLKKQELNMKANSEMTKKADEAKRQNDAATNQQVEAQTVISKIDSALNKVNNLSSGWGSYTKNIPGSPAMNLSADLDSIHSSLGLDKLMEMKANSKAGASGMGQLSDREMSLLISNIASLKQQQTPEQLRNRLNQVKMHYQNILKMNEGINPFSNQQSQSNPPAAPLSNGLMWQGRPIKDTPANRAWLAAQQGGRP